MGAVALVKASFEYTVCVSVCVSTPPSLPAPMHFFITA